MPVPGVVTGRRIPVKNEWVDWRILTSPFRLVMSMSRAIGDEARQHSPILHQLTALTAHSAHTQREAVPPKPLSPRHVPHIELGLLIQGCVEAVALALQIRMPVPVQLPSTTARLMSLVTVPTKVLVLYQLLVAFAGSATSTNLSSSHLGSHGVWHQVKAVSQPINTCAKLSPIDTHEDVTHDSGATRSQRGVFRGGPRGLQMLVRGPYSMVVRKQKDFSVRNTMSAVISIRSKPLPAYFHDTVNLEQRAWPR
ncbi:hypothetical protein V8E53_000786 [Lactarius tabidus]